MNDAVTTADQHAVLEQEPGRSVYFWVGAFIIAGFIAIFLSIRLADAQYQEDIRIWEAQLSNDSYQRAQSVENWVLKQYESLQNIADNTSLKLYMTELANSQAEEATGLPEGMPVMPGMQRREDVTAAEMTFLRNYLIAAAEQSGFSQPRESTEIRANVPAPVGAGIGLFDGDGKLLVSSAGLPPIEGGLEDFVRNNQGAEPVMRDIYLTKDGVPTIAMMVPIFSLQGEATEADRIGMALGVKPVVKELYPLLTNHKSHWESVETYLVRNRNGVIQYISPLKNGQPPLSFTLNADTSDLAAHYAMNHDGEVGFKRDYLYRDVLVIGRAIPNTPWVLVHKIDKKDALENSEDSRKFLISISVLFVVSFGLIIFGVWRHGSSVKFKRLANEFASQEKLLRLVSDNQPDPLYIVDRNTRYRFANRAAASGLEIEHHEMLGKEVKNVVGPKHANMLEERLLNVLEAGMLASEVVNHNDAKHVHTTYVPLQRIPGIISDNISTSGMLVVEQDITEVIIEKQRQERTLNEVVNSMVRLVDARDSNSANHSVRVSQLATGVARQMGLDDVEVETVSVAAKLMNLGKIMLPRDLLTKKSKLTDKEFKQVNEAIRSSADYLEGIEFEGPVVKTLEQAQERWDGKGPEKVTGENILVTARIINIANAFVAMISPRSYRKPLKKEEIIDILQGDAGKQYDRRVVAALANYVENIGPSELDWLG